MPIFYFNLKADSAVFADLDGTDLPGECEALEHARQVAWELMRCQELRTRSWRLQICDAERKPCVELPFAGIDPTIVHLLPSSPRNSIETLKVGSAALSNAIAGGRASLDPLEGTLVAPSKMAKDAPETNEPALRLNQDQASQIPPDRPCPGGAV